SLHPETLSAPDVSLDTRLHHDPGLRSEPEVLQKAAPPGASRTDGKDDDAHWTYLNEFADRAQTDMRQATCHDIGASGAGNISTRADTCCPTCWHAPTKRACTRRAILYPGLPAADVLGHLPMTFPRQVPGIPLRSEVHELRTDIVYAHADGVPLRFDHYRPLRPSGAAVVFVHGGGWIRGDPSQAAGNALHFARRGIATVAISYRLAPAHRFPAPLDDVRHGLRWVRAHASELGIDPERIALLGLSAGAHLAVLAHVVRDLPPELPPELRDVPETV